MDSLRTVAVIDLILAVQPVIKLEEQHQVRLLFRTQYLTVCFRFLLADQHLVLESEIEFNRRRQFMLAVGGKNRTTADKAVLGIERPVLIDAAVHTQVQIPVRTVINGRVAMPDIVVAAEVDTYDIAQVVVDLTAYLTSLVIGMLVNELTDWSFDAKVDVVSAVAIQ